MSFLVSLAASLITSLASWLEGIGLAWWKQHEADVAIQNTAQADESQLAAAKSQGDKDAAATKLASDTFDTKP